MADNTPQHKVGVAVERGRGTTFATTETSRSAAQHGSGKEQTSFGYGPRRKGRQRAAHTHTPRGPAAHRCTCPTTRL
jgi:hypothetical protein